ncbi:MATE family efflux transporter [Sandaracinus amylolyticus]|uniref:Multidrug-efflux transporter n=1 Tax=Sandaracinus amylolyticus TaxID=927083 RepID=A0A0F6YL68_9BACT|nr:MATE family efflux transporter [Sandaracinus amylolyticus]AKF07972.1 Multidrug and toxin extrusion (MATE) family efflux pump YdhE/NorM [Sandaracinus amylolyticus]
MRRAIEQELAELARLATPLVLTNLGNMALSLVDIAIVGRLGASELAAAGLGNAIFFLLAVFGMGLMFGLDPLIAQAVGAGEHRTARRILWQGVWLAVAVTVPLSAIVIAIGEQLHRFDATPEVLSLTRTYLHARLPSLLPFLVLAASRAYLQALGRTRSLLIAVVVANVVNVPVAMGLSFGYAPLGVPAFGIAGAGYATAVATIVQLVIAAAPITVLDVPPGDGSLRAPDRVLLARAVRIGGAIAVQFLIEAGSFSLVTMLMTRFGTEVMGGHQVALSLVSTTFQIALGVGAATSVRVGHAIGRDDAVATRRAGLVGVASGTAIMTVGALVLLAIPEHLASLFTLEPAVIRTAVPLLFVAACFQLSDGAQTIAQGALRGAGDTFWPLVINLSGHYAVGLPLGIALAWGVLDLGAAGLWWGLSAGLTCVAIAMTVRFVRLSRRAIARV